MVSEWQLHPEDGLVRSNGDRLLHDADGYWWLMESDGKTVRRGPYQSVEALRVPPELAEFDLRRWQSDFPL